mgnify:CR=1 FL=1
MKKYLTYLIPPLLLIILVWFSTLTFNLLSAPSDWSVGIGLVLAAILLAIIYKIVSLLINIICR